MEELEDLYGYNIVDYSSVMSSAINEFYFSMQFFIAWVHFRIDSDNISFTIMA